jgi:hypothetical protein
MKRTLLAATAFAVAIAGLAAGSAAVFGVRAPYRPAAPVEAVWSEAKWPFPIDQWGAGRAFVCLPADCGTKVELYVRPKIGFCNCATGVSDEPELERVADTELVSRSVRPRGAGHPVKVGWMHGLGRQYWAADGGRGAGVLSLAYNDGCDAVVAVAKFGSSDTAALEEAILAFLNTTPMVLWIKKELGLEFVRRVW